jgi:periplasmic protein TonB
MPSTAKDTLSEGTATPDLAKNEAQGSQPTNAAGAEIPVTLHASRYSAASKGAGKLPPVHEETRTVIIFPQGAVVRLAATVTPGELVVLTNNRTGTDVVCRVTSVKTQPGIQNYVHLEFTQRALDFWEEASAADRGNSVGKPSVVTALPTEAPPALIAHDNKTPSSPVLTAQPAAKTSVPAAEVRSARAPLPKVTPLADVPAPGSQEISAEVLAGQSHGAGITPAPAFTQKQPTVLPPRSPRLQPFESVIPQKKNTSKTIALFAIAAAVLLAIGAVGGPVLLQRYRDMIVAPQLSNSPATPTPAPPRVASEPVASGSQAPIVNAPGKANSFEPVASTSARNSVGEAPLAQPAPIRPAVEPPNPSKVPKVEVEPPPVARPSLNVGKISAPKVKAAARLNPSEPPPVLPADVSALPGVIGESVGNTTARANSLVPPAPAPPAPPVAGGQLQQPKLLSSVAAVYPTLARAQHVQGDVTIDVLIDATGKVAATNVISGNPLLRTAAIDALRLWKYQPARLNGEAIPVHLSVTIVFHLQ